MKLTKDEFVVGKHGFSYIGDNFKEHLYDVPLGTTKELKVRTLGKSMNDKEIQEELNPEPVTLADLLAFLKTADKSSWYLCYVKDNSGVLWAVDAGWGSDGLRANADALEFPLDWDADFRFLSRGFSDTKTLRTSDYSDLELRIETLEKWASGFKKL